MEGLVRRVVLEHIEDELFLDRLSHAVEVERDRLLVRTRLTEHLKRPVLGRCGECEEA